MIYFTAYETFRAFIAFALFGTFFPFFEALIVLLFKTIKNSFFYFELSYNKRVDFHKIETKYKADLKNKFALFFLDFITITVFFMFFILISCAFYDGILRIYFFLTALVFHLFSKRLLRSLEKYVNKGISLVITALLLILSLFLIPLKVSMNVILKLLIILYRPIENKIRILVSEKHFKKKQKEISRFLQNI